MILATLAFAAVSVTPADWWDQVYPTTKGSPELVAERKWVEAAYDNYLKTKDDKPLIAEIRRLHSINFKGVNKPDLRSIVRYLNFGHIQNRTPGLQKAYSRVTVDLTRRYIESEKEYSNDRELLRSYIVAGVASHSFERAAPESIKLVREILADDAQDMWFRVAVAQWYSARSPEMRDISIDCVEVVYKKYQTSGMVALRGNLYYSSFRNYKIEWHRVIALQMYDKLIKLRAQTEDEKKMYNRLYKHLGAPKPFPEVPA